MNLERERKFLVNYAKLPPLPKGRNCVAGYFTTGNVAIRATKSSTGKAKICFKGPGTEERQEFEYVVPEADVDLLLKLSPTILHKIRYELDGWEIDCILLKEGETLWVAEWEEHEGKSDIPKVLPDWIGREVTSDLGYRNSNLAFRFGGVSRVKVD